MTTRSRISERSFQSVRWGSKGSPSRSQTWASIDSGSARNRALSTTTNSMPSSRQHWISDRVASHPLSAGVTVVRMSPNAEKSSDSSAAAIRSASVSRGFFSSRIRSMIRHRDGQLICGCRTAKITGFRA